MTASLQPFSVPLEPPLETATDTVTRREGFLLRYERGGEVGVGEAAPLSSWTESFRECELALRRVREALDGGDEAGAREAVEGRPAAAHALDCAILDRQARRADRPLYRFLGMDSQVESVPVNAVLGDGSPSETAERAAVAAREGFDCVKIKVGARDPSRDLERLRSVSDTLDDAVSLRIDVNGSWGRDTAEELWPILEEIGIDLVEQPLEPDNLADHAGLRDHNGPEVALDESVRVRGLDEIISADAADLVILKPMSVGGLETTRDAIERIQASGLGVVITTTIDAAVARTAAVHVAATIPNPRPCGLATANRLDRDVAPDPAPVSEGRIHVPQSSGHGVRPWDGDDL